MNDRLLPCDHVIFLIHPCLYEQQDAETVRQGNWQLYVERERQVKQRWLADLAARPPGTLYVQLGGPTYLLDIARSHLGATYVCFPEAENTGDLHRLYVALADCVRHHVGVHKLRFDPRIVTSEVWGESFEGCVPGYGGAFAQYLGLEHPPRLRFEMTVYDSRFLYGARPPATIALPGSDVQAWLFACHDTTAAAMFLSPRTAQWIDRRRLHLELHTQSLQVCTKSGHTVWPAKPWQKGDPAQVCPYSMTLSDCNWYWIRSVGMAYDDFRAVIAAATVEDTPGAVPTPAES